MSSSDEALLAGLAAADRDAAAEFVRRFQRRAYGLAQTIVRDRGEVHPREVDEHFALGTVTNYWGGSSSATTHLLDQMHYRGLLRVVRRDAGIRVYAVHEHAAISRDAKSQSCHDCSCQLSASFQRSEVAVPDFCTRSRNS